MRRGGQFVILAALLTVLGVSVPAMAAPLPTAAGFRVPMMGTETAMLPNCLSSADLDCIESVSVLRDGQELRVRALGGSAEARLFTYPGPDGDTITFNVYAALTPLGVVRPDGTRRADAFIHVGREPDAAHPFRDPSALNCSTGILADCVAYEPALPSSDRFEVILRTSWLNPLQVSTHGLDMRSTWRQTSSGYRFTMSARQMLLPLVDPLSAWPPPPEWNRAKGWDASLYFIVDHAATKDGWSAYDTRCSEHGFPNTSLNAPLAGRPDWIAATDSLDFMVRGPHYAADGSVLRGSFEAEIPLAWLRCRAMQPGLRPNLLEVRVLDEDGIEQAATTTLTSRKGMLRVRAYDFHYSAPTIQIVKKGKQR